MGKSQKPRKKYSNNHSTKDSLFNLSKPKLISMIHKPEGRKELWNMTEQELKADPSKAEIINSIRRKLMAYDELQGVDSQSEQ